MPLRSLLAIALLASALAASASLEISRLRCEYLVDPTGITEPNPRLSWELASDRRGARQSAWQLRVATSAESLKSPDLWDSGRIAGDKTSQISYAGKALGSNQQAFWQLRVWNEEDEASPWSNPASWTMGLLKASDWTAAWIGLPAAPTPSGTVSADDCWIGPADVNPLKADKGAYRYRRSFTFDPAKHSGATLTIAADDRFRAWLNGRVILLGKGGNQAQRLDVLDFLEPGANSLAVQVTNDQPGPTGLLCHLALHLAGKANASTEIRGPEGWKSSRESPSGWEKPGFDDAAWKPLKQIAHAGADPWGPVTWTDVSQALPARMLRAEFECGEIRRATAHLTGLGYHELHINGRKVGDQVLEPALTDYDLRVPVTTHDVTALLRSGPNAIGVWLGNGRYHAPALHVPTPTRGFGAPLLRLQLHLELADGSTKVITSAPTWRASTAGPIRANNDYNGETYDARMEMTGWSEPGFDDSRWTPATTMPAPKGQARHIPCPPIRITERIKPVTITEPRPGAFIFDFGQNLVGWCHLKVSGKRDTSVRLRHAESLRKDGTLYLANMRGAAVTDRYILSGADDGESWEPRFSYHGFRYVEMTGFPGKPDVDALEACVVHSDLEPASTWKSSSETLNQILANARWGFRGNYLSIPTDCPQRDERQGWQGDRAAVSRGEAYLFDVAAFYTKWLDDIRDSQRPADGNVSDVCPAYWPFYSGSAVWPAAQVIIPESLHHLYGDQRSASRHYEGVAKWLEFQLSRRQADGLLPPDPYGDWCAPPRNPTEIHASSPEVVTDKRFVANCYLARNLAAGAWMADLAGNTDAAAPWLDARRQVIDAIAKTWWNADTSSFANGTQTSSLLPLAFDLVPAESRPALVRSLVARIRGSDRGHIGTGLIGAQWLMRTLTAIGHPSLAFEIATRRTYPSWGYMLDHDATTIWELWNGNTADPAMNSHNHVMLVGDLVSWCYEHLAGIFPQTPGFSHISMHPQLVGNLAFVEAEYHSIRGPVRSHWSRQPDGAFQWQLQIPANSSATIFLPMPDHPNPTVTESAKPLSEFPEIKKLESSPPGRLALEIPSGRYHFEVK